MAADEISYIRCLTAFEQEVSGGNLCGSLKPVVEDVGSCQIAEEIAAPIERLRTLSAECVPEYLSLMQSGEDWGRASDHVAVAIEQANWSGLVLFAVVHAGDIVTLAFLIGLTGLAVRYVRGNWNDWIESDMSAGVFASLPVPYWAATLPIVVGFGLMAARTVGDIVAGPTEVDLLTSLGADGLDSGDAEQLESP